MKKALIQGTRICDIVDDGKEFEVHPSLVWVEVDDDTTQRDSYKDGKVVKLVAPNLTPQQKINQLEGEITQRRIREAILGTDSDWLKNKEAEIATERAKL